MNIRTDFYHLSAYRNLLYLKAFLSWDETVLEKVMTDMEEMSLCFRGRNWAVLNNSEDWELHTHSASGFARTLLKAHPLPGQTHNAVVVGTSNLKEWQTNNIFQNIKGLETKIFKDQKAALAWLNSFGYTMTPL